MDLSQVPLDQLLAIRQQLAAPQVGPPPADFASMSLDQLMAMRQQLAGASETPIREGDWQGLANRVQVAGAMPAPGEMGPAMPAVMQERRLAEARRQGEIYGAGRGVGETAFRQAANTAGMGIPAFLEAATSGFGTGLSTAENHEFIKSADEARGRTNPGTNLAATLGGAVAQGIAAPIAPAATAVGRILQAGGIGATTAGIQGAVESRGDPMQAAVQGGIGGAAGLAGGALVERVLAPAGRAIADRVANAVQPVDDRAATIAARALRADGQTPESVRAYLAANPEAVIADAGLANTRSALRGASNLSPMEAHGTIDRALTDRAGREAAALRDAVEAWGGSRSAMQQQEAIRREAQPLTSRLYDEAYRQTPKIEDAALTQFAGTDVGRAAIDRAMTLARAEQAARVAAGERVLPVEFPFRQNAQGVMEPVPGTSMGLQAWDYVRRAVSDMERAAEPGSNMQRMYGNLARNLNTKLDEVSPLYAQARGAAAEAFGARDAVQAGELAMRGSRDVRDIQDLIQRLPSDQAGQVRAGQAAELSRRITEAERVPVEGGTRSLARQIMTPATMARLEATGAPTDDIAKAVDFWSRTADTRRALGNSSTARQLATTAAITGAPLAASSYQNQGMPDPQAAIVAALLLGGRQAQLARQDKLGQELARILMSRGHVPAEKTITGLPPELIGQMLMRQAGSMGGLAGAAIPAALAAQ